MTAAVSFVLFGAPRTKKNSSSIVRAGGRPRIIPSSAYTAWDKLAQSQLAIFRASTDWKLPLQCRLNCKALFLRDAERGDAVGYYQALADTLEAGGIVVNDSQIVSWDGSRMLKDADKPRTIVVLEPIA